MTNQSSQPDFANRQELENERNLRKKYEAQAETTNKELLSKEATLAKYKRLPRKLSKYRHGFKKLKRQRNFYRTASLLLLLIVGYFLVERYQKARELESLRKEVKKAGAPKKILPGIITQEAMERDAESQGGSLLPEE